MTQVTKMRELFEIENDMKELELQMKLSAMKHNKLLKEKFDTKYVEVPWEDAQNYFVKHPPSESYSANKPHATYCTQFYGEWSIGHLEDITVRDNEEGTEKEMWVGGYRHRDGYRRGNPIFIERKYAEKFETS